MFGLLNRQPEWVPAGGAGSTFWEAAAALVKRDHHSVNRLDPGANERRGRIS